MKCLIIFILLFISINAYSQFPDFECAPHTDFGTVVSYTDQINYKTCNIGFSLGYSYGKKSALYTLYKLEIDKVDIKIPREKYGNFHINRTLPKQFRTSNKDYKASGYVRGHLAPSANMDFERLAKIQSYSYINVTPQLAGFNAFGFGHKGSWGLLENKVRKYLKVHKELWVISGPIFIGVKDFIGKDKRIEVPSYFYKIIYNPKSKTIASYILPHKEDDAGNLNKYLYKLECVELYTNLNFFSEMSEVKKRLLLTQIPKSITGNGLVNQTCKLYK